MADEIIRASTEVTVIVPEVWSARFYDVLLATLPFIDSVDRNYEGEIQALGDIVNISTVPEFGAAADLAEDEKADAQAITLTGQQLTINKRPHKDFIVTKKAQLQALSFMDKVRDKAVFAINKKINADIIAAISPSTSAPDHVISYDSGSTLALADILEGRELLDTQDVPLENRRMIVGPAQWNDLFNISSFNSKDFIPAGSPLSSGKFEQQLAGFSAVFSTTAAAVTYLFHPSFLTIAMQQALNIEVFNLGVEGKRSNRVNVDLLWGLKQLDDERVVTIS